LENRYQLRRVRYSTLREPRLIKFKFSERVIRGVRAARPKRAPTVCRCSLIWNLVATAAEIDSELTFLGCGFAPKRSGSGLSGNSRSTAFGTNAKCRLVLKLSAYWALSGHRSGIVKSTRMTHLGHFAGLKRNAERIDTGNFGCRGGAEYAEYETGLLYQVPLKIPTGQYHVSRRGYHSRVAERLLQMIADQWLLGRLCCRDRGAKRQSRVRLPDFFNRDCDGNGSRFGRSPYEMRRRMCSSR